MENYFKLKIYDAFHKSFAYSLYYYERLFPNFYQKIVKQTYSSLNILKTFHSSILFFINTIT